MSKVKVDQAKPVIPKASTPDEMVIEGEDIESKVKASPNYGAAGAVQTMTTTFGAAVAALKANNTVKQKARDELHAAETNEPTLVRRLDAQRRALASAIEVFADGSKDIAHSFNVPLAEPHPAPDATTPENLRPMKSTTHDRAGCRWEPTPGAHGYILQHATNPADPSTHSAEISLSQAKFWLHGQTQGTTVYFRVLACDADLPNGRTAYTAWVAVLVA
jgi:hypothetical protein